MHGRIHSSGFEGRVSELLEEAPGLQGTEAAHKTQEAVTLLDSAPEKSPPLGKQEVRLGGIEVDMHAQREGRGPGTLGPCLYRILQASLPNTTRHGRAGQCAPETGATSHAYLPRPDTADEDTE